MANPDHLDILRLGVAEWNGWRRKNPDIRPDLRKADFHEATLFGTDVDPYLSHIDFHNTILFEADLGRANLTRANFHDADLRATNLSNSNLQEANLNRALLMDADLRSANLNDANLMEANLRKANLTAADMRDAELSGATLVRAVLDGADLTRATLRRTFLRGASLVRTNFSKAHMSDVDLGSTNLSQANLSDAHLRGAFVQDADMSGAILAGANLMYSRFVETNLQQADLTDCSIYGISAWNLNLDSANQYNLVITRPDEPTITVDNIEVGQFIYMLLNNSKIRDVINTITSKAVLILGRFTPERRKVLDALRNELRRYNYLPILFDFKTPSNRNLTETISTLAHIARFVIADITDAKSIPQELQRIVPGLPSLPVQPILLSSEYEYGMFRDLAAYPWFLPLYRYTGVEDLLASLDSKVIGPASGMAGEIEERRRAFEEM